MQPPKRPTHKELSGKLNEAKRALEANEGVFANPGKVVGELDSLEIGDSQEVFQLIGTLLLEIRSTDYAGARPPLTSYEQSIEGLDLFAFAWQSKELKKRMYLKFALKNGRYYYVSLHPDRPEKKGTKI